MRIGTEDIARYLIGLIAIIVAAVMTVFYYILLFAYSDGPPPSFVHQVIGVFIGIPLVGTGVALIWKRYQLALYGGLVTGVVYTVIPLFYSELFSEIVSDVSYTVFDTGIPYADYLPAIVVFAAVFIASLSQYGDMR